MTEQPRLDGAPGHQWQARTEGRWVCIWVARRDIVQTGYSPKTQRLWPPVATPDAPFDETAKLYIRSECERLQDDMHSWKNGSKEPGQAGPVVTVDDLIDAYRTDPDSKYQDLRYRSPRIYDANLKQVSITLYEGAPVGARKLSNIKGRDFKRLFEIWADDDQHIPRASARMKMIRLIVSFGVALLEHPQCVRLKMVLEGLEFPQGRRRESVMTAAQVTAVRSLARAKHQSVALAEALKFDLMVRRKDVIGEYIPMSYPGISAVVRGQKKWLHGFDWSNVDDNMILTHRLSKSLRGKKAIANPQSGKVKKFNLRLAPMVMDELSLIAGVPAEQLQRDMFPTSGPVIIQEGTGLPYPEPTYLGVWRRYATAAGVPKSVQCRDTRAGAATEAEEMGIDIGMISKALGHSKIETTGIYTRGADAITANVAQFRAAKRPGNA